MSDLLFSLIRKAGLDPKFAGADTEILFCCPLCNDHKERLFVNRRTNLWVCHNCQEAGNLWSFLSSVLKFDPVEVAVYADKIHGGRTIIRPVPVEHEAPTVFMPIFAVPLDNPSSTEQKPFWDYLYKRKLDTALITHSRIHCSNIGREANRVIVPVYQGLELKGWVARTIIDEQPKTLTPVGAKMSQVLFNIDNIRPPSIILVEGVFDALALPNQAAATLGAKLSTSQRWLLKQRGFKEVTILYDPDEAGVKGANKAFRELQAAGFKAFIAQLPEGIDPGNATPSQVKQALDLSVANVIPSSHRTLQQRLNKSTR